MLTALGHSTTAHSPTTSKLRFPQRTSSCIYVSCTPSGPPASGLPPSCALLFYRIKQSYNINLSYYIIVSYILKFFCHAVSFGSIEALLPHQNPFYELGVFHRAETFRHIKIDRPPQIFSTILNGFTVCKCLTFPECPTSPNRSTPSKSV